MAKIEQTWAKLKPCPICSAPGHWYKGRNGYGASTVASFCPKYRKDATPDQKAKLFIEKGICVRCNNWMHDASTCPKTPQDWGCRKKDAQGRICGAFHSMELCGNTQNIKSLSYKQNRETERAATRARREEN